VQGVSFPVHTRCCFSLTVDFHFAPQSPVDSPHVSPVPGSQPVSATRIEEVEMNPRPACPIPSSISSLSVANTISSWEQRAALDNRQGSQPPSTPKRIQSSASRSKRRRGYCGGEEGARCLSPTFVLDIIERSYRVSELAAGSSVWL